MQMQRSIKNTKNYIYEDDIFDWMNMFNCNPFAIELQHAPFARLDAMLKKE